MIRKLTGVFAALLFLSGCSNSTMSSTPKNVETHASMKTPLETPSQTSQPTSPSATSNTPEGGILERLNAGGNLHWVEDPSVDITGSNSIATYLEGTADGCAACVFHDAAAAQQALENGSLSFPGQQIYNGPDSQTGLGIVVVSPYAGAPCEYVIAKVFGWGK